jgi:hypothetical protein
MLSMSKICRRQTQYQTLLSDALVLNALHSVPSRRLERSEMKCTVGKMPGHGSWTNPAYRIPPYVDRQRGTKSTSCMSGDLNIMSASASEIAVADPLTWGDSSNVSFKESSRRNLKTSLLQHKFNFASTVPRKAPQCKCYTQISISKRLLPMLPYRLSSVHLYTKRLV